MPKVGGAVYTRVRFIVRYLRYKLSKIRTYKSTRHNFFSTRIVNLWNSLPKNVVEVDTVIHFERQLDKFWQNVEFKFDFRAFPPDRLQPAGNVSQPGSGHRGLY